ncbi:MAG TPA: two-component regulator propeller domain-containing protein [Bacteroidia bacterium]|nr:two-component regulator propeller domain-containing protein [Bacteroidia bacterium]
MGNGNDSAMGAKYPAPKTVQVKAPVAVEIDVCPPVQTIAVPEKAGTNMLAIIGGKTVQLMPPEPKPAGFSVHMQDYTTDQGLALDAVASSCVDHFGNLWFGTVGGGVSRYDGKSFTTFTTAQGLGNNRVFSILEDKKGNLWFGTNGGGVSSYDGKVFTTFTTNQGLGENSVFSMLQDKSGNIWFGTYGGGVTRYDGKSLTSYTAKMGLANNKVLSMLEDKSGNLWFGTFDGGVSKFDGKNFTTYNTSSGLCNNSIRSILQDKNGIIWFGSFGGGVSRYDGKSFTTITAAQGLCNNSILSVIQDKNGYLWFGSFDGGVSCYDGKSFVNFTTEQGLSNNSVRSILQDKTGNIWFGTFGGGVCRYDGKSFITFTKDQGLSNNTISTILQDKEKNLWFGTDGGGVCRYDEKTFTAYTMAQGLANNTVCSILEDKKGNLWFGTDGGGVSCFDGKSFTTYTEAQGLGNNSIISMLEDKNGRIWFGTNGKGVSVYNGKSITTYTTTQGLGNNTVLYIMEDKAGNLWFGTFGGGVTRYDGKTFATYTTAQGLGNNRVWSILEDKTGNIWLGTDGGGLSRYDGKSFTNFTMAQGLPDNTVVQVILTNEQDIAVGTNLGVAVLVGFNPLSKANKIAANIPVQNNLSNNELKAYAPIFEIYNSKTGYPVKDINVGQNCMYLDRQGVIWAGTGSEKIGLVRFDPSPLNRNPNPPTLVIQNIKINEENICWYDLASAPDTLAMNQQKGTPSLVKNQTQGYIDSSILAQQEIGSFGKVLTKRERDTLLERFDGILFDSITPYYPLPVNLVLPYPYNHITFEFAAVEPARPYLVNYQYMLEGYDKDWNPVTNKTSATFGNMSEGTYTFMVKAQNPGGAWTEPVSYFFKVVPPWYRTWWAYFAYAMWLSVVVWSIVRWNGQRLTTRAESLKRKVDEVTIEIREKNKILEEKNKDIIDSINYAKMIQVALLKEEERVSMHLPDHFIVFKPKDIVSGDFYWALEKGGYFYLAAVDCTGHGVPGGFMSMLGVAFLNEITADSELLTPAEILNSLRDKIIKELRQMDEDREGQDGMDMSIMRLNLKSNEVEWSGANNPFWYLTNGELKDIIPDKQPVGYYPVMKPFTNHKIQLEKGDLFYLFTDGYADQFGGPRGKKFHSSQLKEILASISKEPMIEQKRMLKEKFESWKGEMIQVDDVLLMGVRV